MFPPSNQSCLQTKTMCQVKSFHQDHHKAEQYPSLNRFPDCHLVCNSMVLVQVPAPTHAPLLDYSETMMVEIWFGLNKVGAVVSLWPNG